LTEGRLFFEVDSRILFQLGEKLVADRSIALAELIKNSYDADATRVTVEMSNVSKINGKIIVTDNGTGISSKRFREVWMLIATDFKEKNPISSIYKRKKSGEKGIGRFACRRLASTIKIESVSINDDRSKEKLFAKIEWNDFSPGSKVTDIPIIYKVEQMNRDSETYTKIILENVKDKWKQSDINKLLSELSSLITPKTFEEEIKKTRTSLIQKEVYDPGLTIEYIIPEFSLKEKEVEESFFKNAWAKLTGRIDIDGNVLYEIQVINKILNKLKRDYKLTTRFKNFRNANFIIYLFSYRPDLFGKSEWNQRQTSKIVREKGGVKVYADKFRVFGYGKPGDDWLDVDENRARSVVSLNSEFDHIIESDKRPGLRLFRNDQMYGHITFNRETNPELEITINRERLLENDSFNELKKFTRLGIEFATILYSNEISKEILLKEKQKEDQIKESENELQKAREKAMTIVEELSKEVMDKRNKAAKIESETFSELVKIHEEKTTKKMQYFNQIAENNDLEAKKIAGEIEKIESIENKLKKELQDVREIADAERKDASDLELKKLNILRESDLKLLKTKEELLDTKEEKIEKEYMILRTLASTGTITFIFQHELSRIIDDFEDMLKKYEKLITNLDERKASYYSANLSNYKDNIETVKEFGEFLGLSIGKESRILKKDWPLKPIAEKVIKPYKNFFKSKAVDIEIDIPKSLRLIPIYKSEIVSILFNLLSNAYKAVKGQKIRRIKIEAYEKEKELCIRFLDTGKGLEQEKWEIVFDAFESFSEPDWKFGIGTGLGLKITKDIIKTYNGDIFFIKPPEDSWKTCIQISLPLEE